MEQEIKAKAGFHNMTEGKLWKQILQFSLPIFFASILQQIYNMVDVWFVGHYIGAGAIAAIGGATSSFINLSIALFNGFTAAITVIIGQKYGSGKKKDVILTMQNALILCIGLGVFLSIIGVMISPWILHMCGVPDEVKSMADQYLKIYFSGTTAVFLYNVSSGILRAMGDSRRTLYVLACCCILNSIADGVFIGILGFGVGGAAVATVFAQSISAIISLYILTNKKSELHFSIKSVQFKKEIQSSILKMAIPCSVQGMLFGVANLIFQSSINGFGTTVVAAVSVFSKADMLCWWVVESFGVGLTTIVAQNYGAGKKERIKESIRISILFVLVLELCFSSLLVLLAPQYFAFFTNDLEVQKAGVRIVYAVVPFYVTYIFIEPLAGAMKGMGDTVAPLIITLLGICALRIAWVLGAGMVNPDSFILVLWNYPVTWSVTSFVFIVDYWYRFHRRL